MHPLSEDGSYKAFSRLLVTRSLPTSWFRCWMMLCPLAGPPAAPLAAARRLRWPSCDLDLFHHGKYKRSDRLCFGINWLLCCAQDLGGQALNGTSLPQAQILAPFLGTLWPRPGSGLAEGGAPHGTTAPSTHARRV